MCAITGLLTSRPHGAAPIDAMTESLRHRGPDDGGIMAVGSGPVRVRGLGREEPHRSPRPDGADRDLSGSWLALGHRRLSILDLSPLGHQPMSRGDRYWIVYNGEIYNHIELRTELEAEGERFVSKSDTEVILAAYARWGQDCLARFNGMWAIAIYDSLARTIFLARDRFGVKPLYYWQDDGILAFASEIKAFTSIPGWRARLNGQSAHDFLVASQLDHSAQTLFAGVEQMEPGHCALVDCSAVSAGSRSVPPLRPRPWYQPKPALWDGSWDEATRAFKDLLTDSVRLCLRSDVTVGSCLSGGLDSSSIVCIVKDLLGGGPGNARQMTFSSCFDQREFDERPFIEEVVRASGVDAHRIFPSPEGLLSDLDRMLWHQDEPFLSASIFAQWCVFRSAREAGVKVMLDGQGADEHLYGYPEFHRPFLAGLLRSGHPWAAWCEAQARHGSASRTANALGRAILDAAIPVSIQNRFRARRARRKMPRWLGHHHLSFSCPGPLLSRFDRHGNARGFSAEMLGGRSLQKLLHWEDRNSMAHSIEARVPFLDFRLVEFVLGLPDRHKIRGGWTKAVLREGLRGVVPPAVLNRRDKMGFVTPERLWASQTATHGFEAALTRAVESSRGVITHAALGDWAQVREGRSPYRSDFWRMITFGNWMHRFDVSP